jgi:enamine deaminase RidA (YjgF/YER057c/UK114 family)
MANSASPDLVLNNLCIFPETGELLTDQLADCYRQLKKIMHNKGFFVHEIIKQTIFISASSNSEYIQSKGKLLACAKEFLDETTPTSILAQSPENGSLALELIYIKGLLPNEVTHKHNEKASWIVFQRGLLKMIVASGLSETTETTNILLQSIAAFRQLQDILLEEQMEFSDIVRQWNYVEQITGNFCQNNTTSQHYQIFNDVRSSFYQSANFKNGYPAATGIGIDCGGVIIDIIAATSSNKKSVIAVKSPVQLDAFSYTREVLAENNAMHDYARTTPKFERAKILSSPEIQLIFISGTAAIKGQASTSLLSVEQQTEMTIQNILSLICRENLFKHGIENTEDPNINYLRVYVKYNKDMTLVKNNCLKYFPHVPILYVVADICRPELLVEIEGQAVIG